MTPEQICERLRMYELWLSGCNTAAIARRMKLKEWYVHNNMNRRVFRSIPQDMVHLRGKLLRRA